MVSSKESSAIDDLAAMDIKAHVDAGVNMRLHSDKSGIKHIIFENEDELLIYDYEIAQIVPLTQTEINNYNQKLFFDYNLPEGAERAVIESLGLVGYMINIGICKDKNGGK
jgi:hypothetical protein